MIRSLALLLFLVSAAGSLRAESAPAAIQLKHRSAFQVEDKARNPFWPIGWKPAAKVSESSTDQGSADLAPTVFLVSSIAIQDGTRRFAIINGRVMEEGQQFGLQMGTQTYQITVKAIQDGQVILARRDQEIVAPLRRK